MARTRAPRGHPRHKTLHLAVAAAVVAGMTALTPSVTAQTPTPDAAAFIDNGVVQLGVHPTGELNVPDGPLSSGGETTVVGLRYLPTGAESTAPGCLCEGWGAADVTSGATGYANQAYSGPQNLNLIDFQATASDAVSTVEVMQADAAVLRVTHDYHPSTNDNLYEVTVTIENVSDATVDPRYRRVMDWDVEPTAFSEVVTLDGSVSPNLRFSSNDGFASANPLAGPSDIGLIGPGSESPLGAFFTDQGPDDHGALFDFGFDPLPAGGSLRFNIYYGAAGTENDALLALDFVGATVYSLGQPSTPDGPTLGTPNTFIFGFGAVGGDAAPRLGLRKRADAPDVEPGGSTGYTLSLSNPTSSAAQVTGLTDMLPAGFSYTAGSATYDGAALADPTVTGTDPQTLVWAGPLAVPPMSTSLVHFGVNAAEDLAADEYRNVADADAANDDGGLLVRSTGPVAPITVPPPTIATDITASTTGGTLTTDPDDGTFTLSVARGARSDLAISTAVTCPDDSEPSAVEARNGGTSYPMTEDPVGSGTYVVTIPGEDLADGPVEIVATCGADEIINVLGTIMLYDPSGIVTDAETGDPVTGATVTLYKTPFALPDAGGETRECRTVDTRPGDDWSGVAPGNPAISELADPALEPAEIDPLLNPQVTAGDGRYGWDVATGCWFVVVEADGYEDAISALVGVPPEVTDLDIALEPISEDICEGFTAMPFTDVADSNVHRPAIVCAVGLDVVNGTSPTTFAPFGDVSRGQMATLVAGMLTAAGYDLPAPGPNAFTDIAGTTHEQSIKVLTTAGVISGTTPTTYAPGIPVSRAQTASLLRRAHDLAADVPLAAGPNAFDDDNGSVHEPAINAIANVGIATGTAPRTFSPFANVHRDQMTSFVIRTLRLLS